MKIFKKSSKRSFTLVELIIVIAIIAILAVTAFLMLTKWIGKSRDSRRVSDLSSIDSALQLYLVEKNTVPKPDTAMTIYSGNTNDIIGYQGLFTENTTNTLGNLKPSPIDPSDNTSYIYYVDAKQSNYQLLGFAEQTSYNPNTVNAIDYKSRYIQTKGSKFGIILSGDNTPMNMLTGGFDIMGNTSGIAVFDNANNIAGTGQKMQWLYTNMIDGGPGYDSPSSCPTEFIPVPGNKDFNQPGFCVAKYDMKQINGTAGYRHTGSKRITGINEICSESNPCPSDRSSNASNVLNGQITSKADGLPLVWMNQATAIQACKSMGAGYHLITNKERMTIARNIEIQNKNRNSGKVGSGGIYMGKNYRGISGTIPNNQDPTDLSCNIGTDLNGVETTGSLVADANSKGCQLPNGRNKRELYLSNNQIIWDFAGNVWKHVNKADNISGNNFDGLPRSLGSSTRTSWQEWTYSDIDSTERGLYGPSNASYTSDNGIGQAHYGSGKVNDVFVRSGAGYQGISSGIYALRLYRTSSYMGGDIGFRCAR